VSRARLWWLPMRSELRTAYYDLRARLGGWCNDCPARPDHSGGGYAFWRCELRRGHDGLHRAVNYVWSDDGKTSYLPVPPDRGRELPVRERSPWSGRHLTGGYVTRLRRTAWSRRRAAQRLRNSGGPA
jgi:hypothetical protein